MWQASRFYLNALDLWPHLASNQLMFTCRIILNTAARHTKQTCSGRRVLRKLNTDVFDYLAKPDWDEKTSTGNQNGKEGCVLTLKSELPCSVYTDRLQGRIQGKSCPLHGSPPPVWHQGGWDTELWEGSEHLRYRRKTKVRWSNSSKGKKKGEKIKTGKHGISCWGQETKKCGTKILTLKLDSAHIWVFCFKQYNYQILDIWRWTNWLID